MKDIASIASGHTWPHVPLGSVAFVEKTRHDGNLPYVGLEDISNRTGEFLGSKAPQSVRSTTFRFTREHVLYGRLRPYLNKAFLPSFEGHCSSEIFPLRPSERLDRRYLFYWLTWPKTCDRISATSTGARMPRANMNEVMRFDIPLPPLEEQKRIVAVLDQAFAALDRARAHAEANLADSEKLLERAIGSVFTSSEAEGWDSAPLVSLANINYGYTAKSNPEPVGPKLLRITDIQEGEVNWETVPFCMVNDREIRKFSVIDGDLVFARTGATTGKSLLLKGPPNAVCASYLIRLRLKGGSLTPDFLNYFFQSDKYWDEVRRGISGSTQGGFNASKLGAMIVPVPPAERQAELVWKLTNIKYTAKRARSEYEYKLKNIDNLRQSLLQKAFSGRLTA